jgi:MFS transporter, ACS family, DAL5 transporter family protein
MCCAAAKNFGGIFALRFILGMAESNMTPAYMMICSVFFTRQELSLRLVLFIAMNGLATAGGSLIAFGLGHVHSTSITSWQLIFLVVGGANLIWSGLFVSLTPRSFSAESLSDICRPALHRFRLSHECPLAQRTRELVAVDRVSQNMIGIKDKGPGCIARTSG